MQKSGSRKAVIQMKVVGSSVGASGSRIDRPHKKQKDKDDIISKLPYSLRSRILSFLPTKDAARTSVLSRTWMESWTSITKLDLDDSVFYSPKSKKKSGGKQHFINFVNRALLLNENYSVECFSLVITNKYDQTLVNTWISCMLKKNVKKLSIASSLEFPFSALTSRSLFNNAYYLEELVLKMRCCAINVPPCGYYHSFGKLKLLKLCGIIFTIDKSIEILLPVLKKFETKNCSWLSAHVVTLELKAPLLESVFIEQDLESVTREPRNCKIKFSDSSLKEFTYCGDGISQAIVLSDPSSARNVAANIILFKRGNSVQESGSYACLLLNQFSQVKCMKFHGSEVLTQPNMALLPEFAMLTHLDLGSVSDEVLLGFLQKSPVLNTLVFKEITKCDQERLSSVVVPNCLASTLQVVKFGNLHGHEHELFLAKYLMENGIVLERMSFSIANACRIESKVIEEFKEKLYSFKKGVSFAILEFSFDYY